MSLQETARERLADVVELQPTKNAALAERWGMDGGSDVHSYLEEHLGEYYYRDEDSMIRATPEAVSLLGGDASGEVVRVSPLQSAVLDVIAGPTEEGQSVVSVLQDLRETGRDPTVDEVRAALGALADKGVLERIQLTVPTYRLAGSSAAVEVQEVDADEGSIGV